MQGSRDAVIKEEASPTLTPMADDAVSLKNAARNEEDSLDRMNKHLNEMPLDPSQSNRVSRLVLR